MKSLNEIRQIRRYIKMPTCHDIRPYKQFDDMAILKWAAAEIIIQIKDNPGRPVCDIVYDFRDKMISYMQSSKGVEQRHLFKLAADAADEIAAMI